MRLPQSVQRIVLREFVRQTESYFHPPQFRGWDVEQLTERVYTFRWGWYRNIFVVTDEGVFATDPFNAEAASLLREAIREKTGDRPVKFLFYTHYHKDHVEGGAALAPAEVLCHERCPSYFEDLASPDVLPPTRTLSGDETISLGGLTFQLLFLGKTHTDTLYALHIPEENLLFTADFGLVRTFPPIGLPDFYRPGVVRGLDRLSKLDFGLFVPSHFGHGVKQDFLDFAEMFRRIYDVTKEAGERYGRPDEQPVAGFTHVYDTMRRDYGDWHGFDQMILFSVARTATGQLLGY